MIPNDVKMNNYDEDFSQSLTVIAGESLTVIDDEDMTKAEENNEEIDSLSQSLSEIYVKAHYCKRPGVGSIKNKGLAKKKQPAKKTAPARKSLSAKRTHIKEGKERARLSKVKGMDHESFKAILGQMDRDKENFVPDQGSQVRNEQNALLWNNFRNRVQRLPRQRKIKTREEVKKEKARQFQARYIEALNNLDEPMPAEFQSI